MNSQKKNTPSFSHSEWAAIYAAVHYAHRELLKKEEIKYHAIFDWENEFPDLLKKLEELKNARRRP